MAESAKPLPARPARLGALACRPFARLLSGQIVSQVGTQMSNTAGAWVLYRLTHSAQALGIQGLCFSLPIAVLPLLTGVLADRFSRLVLIKATWWPRPRRPSHWPRCRNRACAPGCSTLRRSP